MEETKEKVFNTALELFSKSGYGAVSVRDIAARIGITQGALYRYFESKRELYNFILQTMTENSDRFYSSFPKPKPEKHRNISEYKAETVKYLCFSELEKYKFWTQNKTNLYFRRLLEIERYTDKEAALYFNRYFSEEPLNCAKHIFKEVFPDKNDMFASDTAFRFYSPIYLSYSLYDTRENKSEVTENIEKYVSRFFRQILRKIEN